MFDAPKAVLDRPALSPPSGVTAHLTDSSPDQKWFYISIPLITIISGIFVILHLYTKLKIMRRIQWADYFIIISFVLFLVEIAFARIAVRWGLGVHQWNLRLGDFMHQLFWVNLIEALYCPCIFPLKTAIILQYLQVLAPSPSGNKSLYYGGWALIITMFLFYFIEIPLRLFICSPREKIWNPTYEGGTCMNINVMFMCGFTFSLISDLVVLILPIRTVCNLQITLRKKIIISLQFATGLLATFAGAMRLSYVIRLEKQGDRKDTSYEMAWMGLWAYAEIALGIIVACGLHLPRFFRAKSKEFSQLTSTISHRFLFIKTSFHTLSVKVKSNASLSSKFKSTVSLSSNFPIQGVDEEHGILKMTEIVQEPATQTPTSSERSFVHPEVMSKEESWLH